LKTALKNCNDILGMNLITHQTGEKGKKVNKILITEALEISKEFYVAITLDRTKNIDVFMVSTEGGVDIEDVAKNSPEKIIKEWINPIIGFKNYQAFQLAKGLGLEKNALKQAIDIFKKMYDCYKKNDMTILEINPLVLTEKNNIVALDAKLNFDGSALNKHQNIINMRDESEEDPTELEASRYNLNYIKLNGNVGCMVNGAGLAMATMDIIKIAGGEPANFLDVGGAANINTIKNGFKLILKDKNVKAILINIFGGIVRCDRVAEGVVQAVKELDMEFPVIVRLEGTNSEEAQQILSQSGLSIIPASTIRQAAEKSVKAAKELEKCQS